MKKYRRFLAIAAALAMLSGAAAPTAQPFSAFTLTAAAEETVTQAVYGDFRYFDHGTYIGISGLENVSSLAVEIPSEIDGKPVTYIADEAFMNQMAITSVTVPEGVVTIGKNAFADCSALHRVDLPESLANIGEMAFAQCYALESMYLPGHLIAVPDNCFAVCVNLREVTIAGNSLEFIGSNAFASCMALTTINLPASVLSIGENAFSGTDLQTVNYGGGEMAWQTIIIERGNVKLVEAERTYASTTNGVYNGLTYECYPYYVTIRAADKSLTEVVIPDTIEGKAVENIDVEAFKDCTELTSVTFPEGLARIGAGAFSGCTSLTSVTLPESVIKLGASAFWGCTALTTAELNSRVTAISDTAFSGCKNLRSVALPANLDIVALGAFRDCVSLESIAFPASTHIIAHGAFYGCTSLKEVTLPEGMQTISEDAFGGCDSLESVTIPSTVEYLNNRAFYGKQLQAIHVAEENPDLMSVDGVVFKKDGSVLYTYPSGRAGAYTIPEGTLIVDTSAFADCTELTDITLSDTLVTLMDNAFANCTKLTSITIPPTLQSIRNGVFDGCTALTELNISPDSEYFYAQDGMIIERDNNALIYASVPANGDLVIPECVERIGAGVFQDCTELTSVTFHEGVEFIYASAFKDCTGLTALYFEGTDTNVYIGNYAFSGCTGLTSAAIPEGTQTLGQSAFHGCTSLTEITLPSTLTGLNHYAFEECPIETVYYNGTPESWKNLRFGTTNDNVKNANVQFTGNSATATPVGRLGDADLNGEVNASDAAVILQAAAYAGATGTNASMSVSQRSASDINKDGDIDATDAAYVLQYAAYAGSGGTDTMEDYYAALTK